MPKKFGYTATKVTTDMSDVVTVVTNISDSTIVMGFLPPHGKTLEANESVTVQGDLVASLLAGGGRSHKRKVDAFNSAITNKIISVRVNHRNIMHGNVSANVVIPVGCLVYLDTTIKPAASFTWDTNIATTQANFANSFLGVALDAHADGDAAVTNFRVDTSPTSLHVFTCTSETHALGDTFGPAKNPSSNALLNTQLVKATAASSIARGRQHDASAATSVIVTVQSAYAGHNAAGAQ